MTQPLRHRLILMNLPLIAGLALLALALAWGIDRLRDAATAASEEYTELRLVEEAMFHVASMRAATANQPLDLEFFERHVKAALAKLGAFERFQEEEGEVASDPHQQAELQSETRAESALLSLEAMLSNAPVDLNASTLESSMDQAMLALSRLAAQTDVVEIHSAVAQNTVTAMTIVGVVAALLVAGSILATAACYGAVITPLRRFHRGVRRIASGEFSGRLEESGSLEFVELAVDFNRMAKDLETLYRDLERKVQIASRELVRSERLASVGFLAAGVAHEINNPLNIMSGYAELALRALQSPAGGNGELEAALEIIREETFRCKDITDKLLSLARGGEGGTRTLVSLPVVAREVARMLSGLGKYRDRSLRVTCEAGADAPVRVNAAEMKQVLLNLLVNALESCEPAGEVVVEVRRAGDRIVVAVRDNGCGMTPEVLERAFEPFFSARPNAAARGAGLGLPISFAIVQSYAGSLHARSDGPGLGSEFVMEIPIADVVALAH